MPDYIDPDRQRAARTSDFMEELISSGKRFPVLDQGFVQVVDYMGTDVAIVNTARLTAGTLKKAQDDRGLLRYLVRKRHTTPFEFCQIVLHVRVPMDAWRQWIRHRMSSTNEYSTRYSPAIDARQCTAPDAWRAQSKGNRQGSSGLVDDWGAILSADQEAPAPSPGEYLTARETELHQLAHEVYQERLDYGVAREVARKDLPLSTYTEAYWRIDLHNLMHFLGLRMDPHAQKEIRDYANVIGNEIVAHWVPDVWEAFQDFRLGAEFLTRLDYAALTGPENEVPAALELMTKRERDELLAKIGAFEGIAGERVKLIQQRTEAIKAEAKS